MNISIANMNSVTVVRLAGSLDTLTSPAAEASLDKLVKGGASKVLVNLAEVDFVSSAGLRVLLSTAKKLSDSGGALRISDLNDTVAEVFEISGFITILDVFGSEEEAIQNY